MAVGRPCLPLAGGAVRVESLWKLREPSAPLPFHALNLRAARTQDQPRTATRATHRQRGAEAQPVRWRVARNRRANDIVLTAARYESGSYPPPLRNAWIGLSSSAGSTVLLAAQSRCFGAALRMHALRATRVAGVAARPSRGALGRPMAYNVCHYEDCTNEPAAGRGSG
jgi:hypothetical protein